MLDVRVDHIALLKNVAEAHQLQVKMAGALRTLQQDDVLIQQGVFGTEVHFLIDGELGVALGEPDAEPIAVLGPGEAVGELAVLTGEPASAFVVARQPCQVVTLSEGDFWELVQASNAFAVNLIVKLANRLRRNNATVSTNIEKRRLYERAALFDGLTGVHNRRWLDETLHRLVERHGRDAAPLCLGLIDIDHFKRFNDGHGHDAGDVVLSTVASTLAKNLRPTDLVARLGGEEFVILLPDTGLDEALAAGERVREVVSQTKAVMPDGRELPRVTISMGVAQLAGQESPAELLKAADKAMYEAKEGGRNRVLPARR